jgi:hypothetical protein
VKAPIVCANCGKVSRKPYYHKHQFRRKPYCNELCYSEALTRELILRAKARPYVGKKDKIL